MGKSETERTGRAGNGGVGGEGMYKKEFDKLIEETKEVNKILYEAKKATHKSIILACISLFGSCIALICSIISKM